MIFNDETRDYLYVLRGRDRPAWSPVERYFVESSNLPGGHLSHSKKSIRRIKVPIRIVSDSFVNLQKVKEDMANWLVHDEPKDLVFKDEPDRVYYALVDGGIDLDELIRWGEGILEFVCPDPFKYAKNEKVIKLTDSATVENKGSEITYPKIKMVAKKASTFAMINNPNDEYMLLGHILNEDGTEEVVNDKPLIFGSDGTNLDGWNTQGLVVDENFSRISGKMQSDGTGIRADGYGTGNLIHGPAVKTMLPKAIQDFEINTNFDIISDREEDNFRMELYFFDEAMNMLGKMGIKDNSRFNKRRAGLGRVGPYRGKGKRNGYAIGEHNYYYDKNWNNTLMNLSVKRKGNLYTFYIARWQSGQHRYVVKQTFRDSKNEYMGKLRYVQLFIGSYKDRRVPRRLRVNNVDVYELIQIREDQTPYLFRKGDVIEFDHDKESVSVNGVDFMHNKQFGANFFGLNSGINTLTVSPENTFDTEISYRERYK